MAKKFVATQGEYNNTYPSPYRHISPPLSRGGGHRSCTLSVLPLPYIQRSHFTSYLFLIERRPQIMYFRLYPCLIQRRPQIILYPPPLSRGGATCTAYFKSHPSPFKSHPSPFKSHPSPFKSHLTSHNYLSSSTSLVSLPSQVPWTPQWWTSGGWCGSCALPPSS